MIQIHVLTLFPQMFSGPFSFGLFKKANENGILIVDIRNIRDFTHDKHHTTDDYPYGGGAGMVMKPEPIFEAVETIKNNLAQKNSNENVPVILLSPQGRLFNQAIAVELSHNKNLVLICGQYEGIDERVCEHLVTDEISIGDYILSGGELAAMVVINTISRLIPGFLGSPESLISESHNAGLLEYPQYTRPHVYRDWYVPDILFSGNHAEIAKWRRQQSILRTLKRRPELMAKVTQDTDKIEALKNHIKPR